MTEKQYPLPGKQKVQLFMGRMQPIHLGHKRIIESMKNPVVIVVKGEGTGKDRNKNPLSAEYQIKLIKKVAPRAKIIVAPGGFLPKIIGKLREDNMEPDTIYAGADRIAGYQNQIKSANARMEAKYHYKVEFKETERVTSATTVRNALRNDDRESFEKNMPKELWPEYETMRKLIAETYEVSFWSFRDWLLKEDGEGGGSAVTSTSSVATSSQVAQKDVPLGKKHVEKRKKLDDDSETDEDEDDKNGD